MLEFTAKTFAFVSILKNSVWIAVLMVCMAMIDPKDIFAVIYRVTLKGFEFYIIWSSYGAFKLIKCINKVKFIRNSANLLFHDPIHKLLFQKKHENLSYFLNDCIISGILDFIIASIFIVRFIQHGKGFEFSAIFATLFALNMLFFIIAKLLQRQMKIAAKSDSNLDDFTRFDDYYEMLPIKRNTSRMVENENYCYDVVFREMKEIYSNI
jgi:hypothetical protein